MLLLFDLDYMLVPKETRVNFNMLRSHPSFKGYKAQIRLVVLGFNIVPRTINYEALLVQFLQ